MILHLYARSKARSVEDAIVESVAQVQGAFSLVMLTKDRLIAVRDPHGFRPLALGRLGDAWVVCSETCAMDLIGATYERDVQPGEIVIISADGLKSIKPFPPAPLAHCIFEHVYFARPDSYVFGRSVNEVRTELGRVLAREQPVDADVVVPVPDSGVCAAMGFHEEVRRAAAHGADPQPLRRPHVHPAAAVDPALRRQGQAEPGAQHPRTASASILVDDSIVRGTTSRKIVRMVRAAGAKEVHVRISCPPTISPCFYGVDTPRKSELIGATHTIEEIREFLEADSVAYLSLEGMLSAVKTEKRLVLHVVLHGHLPGRVPARRSDLPAARAQARQQGRDRWVRIEDETRSRPLCLLCVLCVLCPASGTRAQEPPAPQTVSPRSCRRRSPSSAISITRRAPPRRARSGGRPARRRCRRCCRPSSEQADGYVRYRALVLLTGFNDPRTKDAMRESLGESQRSPAHRRLQLLRAQPRSRDAAACS